MKLNRRAIVWWGLGVLVLLVGLTPQPPVARSEWVEFLRADGKRIYTPVSSVAALAEAPDGSLWVQLVTGTEVEIKGSYLGTRNRIEAGTGLPE